MSQAKAIVALILFVLIVATGWFVKDQADEIGDLTTKVAIQKNTIAALNKEQKLATASNKLDGKAVTNAAVAEHSIIEHAQVTEDTSNSKEDAIRRKYDKLLADARAKAATNPPAASVATPPGTASQEAAILTARTQEISANRLDGLWTEYCQGESTLSCAVATSKPTM